MKTALSNTGHPCGNALTPGHRYDYLSPVSGWLKRTTLSLLCLLLITPVLRQSVAAETFAGYSQPFVVVTPRLQPPDLPFIDAEGKSRSLSEYQGQLVLLNFWASWCSACMMEMPALNHLQSQMAAEGFTVLTLNQDLDKGAIVRQLLDKSGAPLLTAHIDPHSQLGQALGQTFLPTTLLIDTEGQIAGQLIGPAEWDSPRAMALLRSYLP